MGLGALLILVLALAAHTESVRLRWSGPGEVGKLAIVDTREGGVCEFSLDGAAAYAFSVRREAGRLMYANLALAVEEDMAVEVLSDANIQVIYQPLYHLETKEVVRALGIRLADGNAGDADAAAGHNAPEYNP